MLNERVGDAVTFAFTAGAVRSRERDEASLRMAGSWRHSNSVMRKPRWRSAF
jgi:hypothetical protein